MNNSAQKAGSRKQEQKERRLPFFCESLLSVSNSEQNAPHPSSRAEKKVNDLKRAENSLEPDAAREKMNPSRD